MAKIKVHQLAGELNMTNRALLEKLIEMGISVKSHMSSLNNEDVVKIKAAISGENLKMTNVREREMSIYQQRGEDVQITKARIIKKAQDNTQDQQIRGDSDKSKSTQETIVFQNQHQENLVSSQEAEFKILRTRTSIEHEIEALRFWLNKKENLLYEINRLNNHKKQLDNEIERLDQEIKEKQKKTSRINSDKSDLPDFMKGI